MQANYQLVLPDMKDYLLHIGAQSSWAGIAIGCCDVATLPGAIGMLPECFCTLAGPCCFRQFAYVVRLAWPLSVLLHGYSFEVC